MNICKNCKHWNCHVDCRELQKTNYCNILKSIIEIEIDQGRGWDSGGASVDEINTPFDFGCNKFEPMS
jgi:hypothetical protein